MGVGIRVKPLAKQTCFAVQDKVVETGYDVIGHSTVRVRVRRVGVRVMFRVGG